MASLRHPIRTPNTSRANAVQFVLHIEDAATSSRTCEGTRRLPIGLFAVLHPRSTLRYRRWLLIWHHVLAWSAGRSQRKYRIWRLLVPHDGSNRSLYRAGGKGKRATWDSTFAGISFFEKLGQLPRWPRKRAEFGVDDVSTGLLGATPMAEALARLMPFSDVRFAFVQTTVSRPQRR